MEQYVHRKVWDEGWKDRAFTAFLGSGSDALKRSFEATPEHQPGEARGTMGRHHKPITHQQRQRILSRTHPAMWVSSCFESLVAVELGTGFFAG
jgi:hypothetical protein